MVKATPKAILFTRLQLEPSKAGRGTVSFPTPFYYSFINVMEYKILGMKLMAKLL